MGSEITRAEGNSQFSLFLELKSTLPNPDIFPDAVCYSINELITFLNVAKDSLTTYGIPSDEQGIAIMLGISNDNSAGHAKDKVSVMLVATAFQQNNNREVTKISNYILGDNGGLGNVTAEVFNSGSMFP